MAELKIKIGSEVSGALSGLQKVQTQMQNTAKASQVFTTQISKVPQASGAATQSLVNLSRVAQDAPFGFIGIANNLNPLLEGFQRLKAETGSTGKAFSALGATMIGPAGIGLALGVVSSLLISFGDTLFGAKKKSEESEKATIKYKEALDDLKKSIDNASNSLQFLNSLGTINVKIAGAGNLEDLRQQSVAQREFTQKLVEREAEIRKLKETALADDRLSNKDRVELERQFNKDIFEVIEKQNQSRETQRLIFRKIELQKVEDLKNATEEQRKAFEEFQRQTIDKAKKIEDAFGDAFKLPTLKEDFKTSFNDVFNNALKIIGRFNDNKLLRFEIKPSILSLEKELKKPEFSKTVTDLFEKAQPRLKGLKPIDVSGLFTGFKNAQDQAKLLMDNAINAAQIINNTLAPAFDGLFQSIFEGGNALEGFFQGLKQSIQQLVSKLVQAAAFAAVLSAITGGAKSGGLGFLSAFKQILGFRAEGGPVGAGSPYIVGERGPELFVPSVSGNIIPNNRMGSVSSGGVQVFLSGEFVQRGNDMVAVINRTNQSQGRLG